MCRPVRGQQSKIKERGDGVIPKCHVDNLGGNVATIEVVEYD
jgi:hypothetical protein